MALDWNSKKVTRSVWATLVMTTFALCVLFAFVILNLGSNDRLISQGSTESIPHSEKLTEEECIPVCSSEQCIQQSRVLLDYMQPAVNPCDNFQKFTCGSFVETFPDSGGSWGIRLNERLRIRVRSILENLAPSPDSASDKMKIMYDSCMKKESEITNIPTLQHILEELGIKDWPYLTPDFQFGNTTLAKVVANLLLHGEDRFFRLDDENNRFDSDHPYILRVTTMIINPILSTSNEGTKRQADRVLNYFNLDSDTITKILEEREAINTEIERLKMDSKENSLDEDARVFCTSATGNGWADLCEVINSLLDVARVSEEARSKYVTAVSPGEIHYFQNVFTLLRNFSDRAVANYLAMEVILNHLNDLNLYFRVTQSNTESEALKLFGIASKVDRWPSCVEWIWNNMQSALLYEYSKKDLTLTLVNELSNMTYELIHETAEYFSKQEWVSESIREEKTEELRQFVLDFPSVTKYPTDTAVNGLYEEFKPDVNGNFLNNVIQFRKFKTGVTMRKTVDKEILVNKIFKADAEGGGGLIDIGLTLLHDPYFSTKAARIFNQVSLGFTIVHEIAHSMFGWRDFRMEELQKKMACLTDQVSQYQFELIGKNLNGEQYIIEDIADSAATSITDKIIERYLSERNQIFVLPGLPFPTEQLLYIKSALIFCSASFKRKEEMYSQGDHPPHHTRIYQRGRNSKVFSEAFDCPVGSFMNPAEKCQILSDGTSL